MIVKSRKVYVPVLFSTFGHVVDGEEQSTEEDAERFGIAMAEKFMEETREICCIQIEHRITFCV